MKFIKDFDSTKICFWFRKKYNPFIVWHSRDDVDGLSIYLYAIRHVLKQKKILSLPLSSLTISLVKGKIESSTIFDRVIDDAF